MPGGYSARWADTYRTYIMFGTGELRTLAEKLEESLEPLDDYYSGVRRYLIIARKLKASPGDAALQQELATMEVKLCGKDMLRAYHKAALAGLAGLAAVADAVAGQLSNSSSSQVGQGIQTVLLEIRAISDDLKKDLEAYVTKTLSTLLALRAVGGTDNMPPLPPLPSRPGASS